jgi:hypothetical protein
MPMYMVLMNMGPLRYNVTLLTRVGGMGNLKVHGLKGALNTSHFCDIRKRFERCPKYVQLLRHQKSDTYTTGCNWLMQA